MKKRLTKVLGAVLILISCFIPKVYATTNYSELSSNNYVYVDSNHWRQNSNGSWSLADANFHQSVCGSWAYVNRSWYYLDKNGIMLSDTFFYDVNANKYYYMTSTGSMLVNNTYTDSFTGVTYSCSSDGALTPIKQTPAIVEKPKEEFIWG